MYMLPRLPHIMNVFLSLQLAAISNHDRLGGLSLAGSNAFNSLDDVHTLDNTSENNMLAVQPFGLHGAEKELGTVGVWPSVSHGQNTRSSVLELEVLISEFVSVDGFPTSSVSDGEITTLAHKLWDYAMEHASFEMQRLTGLSHTFLPSAQTAKVLNSLGHDIGFEFHDNASGILSADSHIEENL